MNDSYSATRIKVMRTQLIPKGEYDRLVRMSDSEIINYLQGTTYREDVVSLGMQELKSIEDIDRIIAHNDRRTLEKLKRISSERFRNALRIVLEQNDRWNVQVIAEAIMGEQDAEEALEKYGKVGTGDPARYAGAQDIQGLWIAVYGSDHGPPPENLPELIARLGEMEDSEDKTTRILADEKNIIGIVQHAGSGTVKLREGTIRKSVIRKAAGAPNVEEALDVLKDTPYGEIARQAKEDPNIRGKLEELLRRVTIERIRRHTRLHPHGADVLFNYLVEKEAEHENLRLLVKGKRLGLEKEFIRRHLV